MSAESFVFERYRLDVTNRLLTRDDETIDLSPRYLDALTLLVREQGNLVPKTRFLDEVWKGVPVTDEALTQAIRTLRRQLGDDASTPRFIETVPKHGYRFIAPVTRPSDRRPTTKTRSDHWPDIIDLTRTGTIGAGIAGIIGGLIYGLAEASNPLGSGSGAISVLLVFMCITTIVASLGGAGVTFGMATAQRFLTPSAVASILGGTLGGLLVGALVKLIGVDAFNLLVGQSPGDVTGAFEGALLGAAIGLSAWASRVIATDSIRKSALIAAAITGLTGMLIPLLGGRMLGGSLELLAESFPNSRLQFGQMGRLFGEDGFGPITELATGGLEGALFGSCLVIALTLHARRRPKQAVPAEDLR
ncbi:winged helix-turn-helix domain-containing protein [Pelagibacterium luteolum]|uniref:DNA-binding winged helix-turn-helix (WHTH) domain-containing protein n=1 Tax=Pelagibacterium luteolum TaxID=440168 RepID=A0A1G7UVV1_9HYPH|nr:winged helix-turn-helix domain-containing protein [Pelagibacterium luteolum]SDG51672.1 DNA-binding winged helix-turn-helix (wHTH) domain-containing protein [Pelagibacterium luteolum]